MGKKRTETKLEEVGGLRMTRAERVSGGRVREDPNTPIDDRKRAALAKLAALARESALASAERLAMVTQYLLTENEPPWFVGHAADEAGEAVANTAAHLRQFLKVLDGKDPGGPKELPAAPAKAGG